jgi:translation initiation factor IF-2
MPEAKTKKLRIYKLASEYNLSAENLVEFLRGKGHDVKSHMSMLSDQMIQDINNHFKKDIEKAEKHYKKIAEFNKKRTEKAEQEEGEKSVKIEETDTEIPVEEIVVQSKVEEKVKDEATALHAGVEEKETLEVSHEDEKSSKAHKEIESGKRKGLRVVGKIDLEGDKKEKATEKQQPAVKKRKKPKAKKKAETVAEDPALVKKKKRVKRFEIDEKEVKEAIRKTLLSMDDSVMAGRALQRKKKRKEREAEQEKQMELKSLEQKKIKVNEYIAANELANLMDVPVGDVISKCIELGLMVSINQRLDIDTITLVADEFGFEVEIQEEYTSEILEDEPDDPESLKPHPPVVTIMGHVDHGKTSLLDYIRRTNVVAGEAGGITQHIGAYRVDIGDKKFITFLDTPGHEAFTAMRARGAQLTDIVVIVVAADDAVMPQTVEAINHAQAAGVPMVIAINKIDKPVANPEKIKQQLADRNILVEEWGGKFQSVEISAKSGKNVDSLLEKILLEAELLDLKANPNREARGAVVESELDRGRGITGTILVQKGVLRIGDSFVAGIHHGKVRAMFDERGNKVVEAYPSTPVLVLGFEGAPQAGDTFIVVESERNAREISLKRQQLKREQDQKQVRHITLDEIAKRINIGGVKELALIVKGDVDGSVEALSDSLMKLSNEEVIVRVLHKGVGGISESDVLLASASDAIIIGFHVRPNLNARKLAETQKVDVRLYNVIYDAINEVKSALEGLLSPVISEEVVATLEVRDTFKVPKFGTVAGCYVQEGKISRNNKIRLIRDGIVIQEGEIASLRRFKDDIKEVDAGYECGLNIANYNDVKVGDVIEAYKFIETKKKLA